jgi:probable O-glycosylation ligase (exosortase A-associated)
MAVFIAVLLAPDKWKSRMDPTRKDAMDGSAYSRINAWTFSWRLAMDYPLTGGGFETFSKELFIRYAPNPGDVHGPHSIYFGVLGEHGFVGLLLYLAMVVAFFSNGLRVLKWAHTAGDWVAQNYALMFMFSLTGFLVSGCFLGRQYFDYMFTILACGVALKRACLTRWDDMPGPEPVMEEAA